MTTFHIITLFPEAFDSYLSSSIVGRAIRSKKIRVSFYNPRDFTTDKHRRVDRRPYGGGPGMVLEAEPILKAVGKIRTAVEKKGLHKRGNGTMIYHSKKSAVKTIVLTPNGKQFDTGYAKRLAKNYSDAILIAGHYEGIDARVKKILKAQGVSVGPYTLTGGEVPAMVVIDAVARRVPGVLGKEQSLEERRVASAEVYTRPEVLTWKGKKYRVPKVLLSGHHAKVNEWKAKRTKRT